MSSALAKYGARLRPTSCIVAVAVLIAGCGSSDVSDEDKVKAVTRDYLQSLGSDDHAGSCDQLAASAKVDLVEYITSQVPEVGTTDCEAIVKQLTDLTDESELEALDNVTVTDVTINGDSATATVRGATQRTQLRKIDGDWKIAELTFEAPESDQAPPEQPPAVDDPAVASGEISEIRERLQSAGYEVRDEDPGSDDPIPAGALSVPLQSGGRVIVYVFESVTDVAVAESDFVAVVEESPDQIATSSEGSRLFVGTIQEPATLSRKSSTRSSPRQRAPDVLMHRDEPEQPHRGRARDAPGTLMTRRQNAR